MNEGRGRSLRCCEVRIEDITTELQGVHFSIILKYIPDFGFSRFSFGVYGMLGPLNGR